MIDILGFSTNRSIFSVNVCANPVLVVVVPATGTLVVVVAVLVVVLLGGGINLLDALAITLLTLPIMESDCTLVLVVVAVVVVLAGALKNGWSGATLVEPKPVVFVVVVSIFFSFRLLSKGNVEDGFVALACIVAFWNCWFQSIIGT